MAGNEARPDAVESLDTLIEQFAESGYAPSGAEVEGDETRHDHHHGPGHGGETGVRRLEYRGHDIEIATRYEVKIDGEPWEGHLMVQLDGSVTYHGLPQYATPSAVDLIQAVVDVRYEAPADVQDAIRAASEEG